VVHLFHMFNVPGHQIQLTMVGHSNCLQFINSIEPLCHEMCHKNFGRQLSPEHCHILYLVDHKINFSTGKYCTRFSCDFRSTGASTVNKLHFPYIALLKSWCTSCSGEPATYNSCALACPWRQQCSQYPLSELYISQQHQIRALAYIIHDPVHLPPKCTRCITGAYSVIFLNEIQGHSKWLSGF